MYFTFSENYIHPSCSILQNLGKGSSSSFCRSSRLSPVVYGEIGGDSRSMGVYDEIPSPRIDLFLPEIFTGRERFRNYPSILVEGLNSFFLKEKAIFRGRGRGKNGAKLLSDEMVNTYLFFFFLTRFEKKLKEVSFFLFLEEEYCFYGKYIISRNL